MWDESQRPYILAAPVGFLIFFIGVCVAFLLDDEWMIIGYDLSDLGTMYRTLPAAVTFDYCCCLAGGLISVYGMGKCRFEKGLNYAAGVLFILGGLGLVGLGICNADIRTAHNIVAGVFAITMTAAIVVSTFADYKDGYKYVLYASILILIYLIAEWPFFTRALSECMSIGSATVWFLVQIYKYWKIGVLSSPAKTE